jgi:hypothetical protein
MFGDLWAKGNVTLGGNLTGNVNMGGFPTVEWLMENPTV